MEITISIPDLLASKAKSSGLPPDVYIERLLIRLAAASADQESRRERLGSELAADWEHFRTTGLHLDEDEVDGWLARLEGGENPEPPPLHN